MTADATCRIEPVAPIPGPHPLAHRAGIDALLQMLAADQHWRPIPAAGKAALRDAYQHALAAGTAAGHTEIPMPQLGDHVHPATIRSLERRGLAADGALTPLGVEVVRWAAPLDQHRRKAAAS